MEDNFRPMRRKRQQLSDEQCQQILGRATYGVLSVLGDDGYPYGVPVNYVCHDGKLYFHTALTGHKVDAMCRRDKVREEEYLLNPMPQIGQEGVTVAPHWYIRHGSIDRDTAFPVALNLATRLENAGKDVNFLFAWNRPHSGDYALNELFDWIDAITR